ncbi:MAG: hypothetical protein V7719_08575 [Psychroserpens sp.]
MKTISKLTGTQDTVTNLTAIIGIFIVNTLIVSFTILASINGIH